MIMKRYKITFQVRSKRDTNSLIKFLFKTFAVVSGSLFIEEIEEWLGRKNRAGAFGHYSL